MAGRPKVSQANRRLQANGIDILGWLIKDFKDDPTFEKAHMLLPYAHGKQAPISDTGDAQAINLVVSIGQS